MSNPPENMACNIDPGINMEIETVLSQIIAAILKVDMSTKINFEIKTHVYHSSGFPDWLRKVGRQH